MQSPSNLPSSHFPLATARQEAARPKDVSLYEKNETTLPGSCTRNHSIHFADRTRKCNAKQLRTILPRRASFLSTRSVPVGFDEFSNFGTGSRRFDGYDESLVQEQRAGFGACPAKERGAEVELLCLSLGGISACGVNSVMILTH